MLLYTFAVPSYCFYSHVVNCRVACYMVQPIFILRINTFGIFRYLCTFIVQFTKNMIMEQPAKAATPQQIQKHIDKNSEWVKQLLAAFRSNYHLELYYFTHKDTVNGIPIVEGVRVMFEKDTGMYEDLKRWLEDMAGNLVADSLACTAMLQDGKITDADIVKVKGDL